MQLNNYINKITNNRKEFNGVFTTQELPRFAFWVYDFSNTKTMQVIPDNLQFIV